jgi:predicted amidohydrolase YtcJ
MQPTHATSDMPWAEQRVGPERLAGAYAWQRFLGGGVPLAFGSDFPVESTDPRLGLYAAVTRQDLEGMPPGGWLPDQRVSIEDAIRAFTAGAAWAGLQEHELGRLAPGYLCDVTVFDADPFALDASALPQLPIAATLIEGEIVFRK